MDFSAVLHSRGASQFVFRSCDITVCSNHQTLCLPSETQGSTWTEERKQPSFSWHRSGSVVPWCSSLVFGLIAFNCSNCNENDLHTEIPKQHFFVNRAPFCLATYDREIRWHSRAPRSDSEDLLDGQNNVRVITLPWNSLVDDYGHSKWTQRYIYWPKFTQVCICKISRNFTMTPERLWPISFGTQSQPAAALLPIILNTARTPVKKRHDSSQVVDFMAAVEMNNLCGPSVIGSLQ